MDRDSISFFGLSMYLRMSRFLIGIVRIMLQICIIVYISHELWLELYFVESLIKINLPARAEGAYGIRCTAFGKSGEP